MRSFFFFYAWSVWLLEGAGGQRSQGPNCELFIAAYIGRDESGIVEAVRQLQEGVTAKSVYSEDSLRN